MTVSALSAVALTAAAAAAPSARLLDILAAELSRNFAILKEKASPPPYFISYEVTEVEYETLSAAHGALESHARRHRRTLDVTVRVGTPQLDNYHSLRGERPVFTSGRPIAIEDSPNAIRQAVWRETDRVYRLASQRLIRIQTDQHVNVEQQDRPPDFSSEQPSVFLQAPPKLVLHSEQWAERLRTLSREFDAFPSLLSSGIALSAQRETKYLVNTEGTRLMHGRTFARIHINASAKAPDGMDLVSTDSFEALQPDALPPDKTITAAIRQVAADVTQLIDAPTVEPYVAPAILSGPAAGVFFHEIFGHRIEGHRQKDITEGQTFTDAVGTKVLPEFLSVIFDPTETTAAGRDLMGAYDYDDEGVKARRVPVVEDGIMKTFLLSRSPIRGFPKSNGHGRKEPGREVVSRQSNLFVVSTRQVPETRLRQMLIEEIRRHKKAYGFYFERVTGGFTTTGRRGVQAFKVIPLVVYRVYPDGRPDELVRGADIVGTPLAAFAKIIATGDRLGVFNGYCGAESGSVPVSAVSPALLVSELEIQRKESSQDRPPLLPRPTAPRGTS